MSNRSVIDILKLALMQNLPGKAAHEEMMPLFPESQLEYFSNNILKEAAVLICLFPIDNIIHTILIERTQDAGPHSGQIAFPGGRKEQTDENIIHTAIREAYEELGINSDNLNILGCLTPVSIPVSGYSVTPVVAFSDTKPNLIPEKEEVKSILICNVADLLASKTEKELCVRNINISAPCYIANNYVVWGATAMVLNELQSILELALTHFNQ